MFVELELISISNTPVLLQKEKQTVRLATEENVLYYLGAYLV